jgi:hypothetical protein
MRGRLQVLAHHDLAEYLHACATTPWGQHEIVQLKSFSERTPIITYLQQRFWVGLHAGCVTNE